tara:strand:+ start:269 stop:469 length:201 start_codon:yes stop_codon:yes gene_type:complete
MASTIAFQAIGTGSNPVTRSNFNKIYFLVLINSFIFKLILKKQAKCLLLRPRGYEFKEDIQRSTFI